MLKYQSDKLSKYCKKISCKYSKKFLSLNTNQFNYPQTHTIKVRIKEGRLAAKPSQKKLGIAAGMDEFSASARMNHYEMARHNPDYATLKRIADVLKILV